MATTTVRWLNEQHFVGIDSGGHSVVLSGQKNGIGVSPSQMLLVALASCSSVDVVEILKKKRMKLTLLEVTTSGEQDPEPPWAYRKIHDLFKRSLGPDAYRVYEPSYMCVNQTELIAVENRSHCGRESTFDFC
jgi:putative redox protein